MQATIKILSPKEIDIDKWDALVNEYKAPIYCKYNYINTLCKNWKAIVVDDYKLVLPIPYKTKLAIPYAYSVPFIQQLGFIGDLSLIEDFDLIRKSIKKIVKLGEIYANYSNSFLLQQDITVKQKLNLVLPLIHSYQQLQESFSKDALRNIAKANKQNFKYTSDINIDLALKLYKEFYSSKMKNIAAKDYEKFEKLCVELYNTNQCFCRGVLLNNELVACAIILKDDYKLYNVANTTTEIGKKLSANYYLFSSLFQEFENSNLIFDFEGSEIAGVKKFYESFGSIPQPYFMWQFNFFKF